ncbi:hypothetical protein M427DRAFT_447427 [Gonapodya prolifera JEL478]|uniref:Uncharacterized protein n=1 Tax=Gonapodya prolifera (strain JEL478) TaxID=1344416 RepID=A0A139A377_GONPJ|nr:hypothetical protein M427DRAFT_447427 [Gonapodya prolifera JEL478]|eukprot:KXS11119.1 hypothetical protein M427DRAFT_447427 [Gonapodya prolifera JEL478]
MVWSEDSPPLGNDRQLACCCCTGLTCRFPSTDRRSLTRRLTLEILHRILRLFPPAMFFRDIPLLSKSIGAAARTALPGYSDGEVGILCSVVVRPITDLPRNATAPNWWDAVEKEFRFLPRSRRRITPSSLAVGGFFGLRATRRPCLGSINS